MTLKQQDSSSEIEAIALRSSIAKMEDELIQLAMLTESECSAIEQEKSFNIWVGVAGILVVANLIIHISVLSVIFTALYFWGLHYYIRNWTPKARSSKLRRERKDMLEQLRKALNSMRTDLADTERKQPGASQ